MILPGETVYNRAGVTCPSNQGALANTIRDYSAAKLFSGKWEGFDDISIQTKENIALDQTKLHRYSFIFMVKSHTRSHTQIEQSLSHYHNILA